MKTNKIATLKTINGAVSVKLTTSLFEVVVIYGASDLVILMNGTVKGGVDLNAIEAEVYPFLWYLL